MQAVILAGGRGTRLAPYTTILPKPLMPVGEMPVLEIILRQLRQSGFERIELATGHLSGLIAAYFGDGSRFGLQIRYHVERDRAGTAGPIALLEDALDSTFLIMNGDVLTDLDCAAMFAHHLGGRFALTAATCRRSITLPLGSIIRGDDQKICRYVEKPQLEFECSAGIYVADQSVVKHIERNRPYDLPELVMALLNARQSIEAYPITGFWYDIGTPDDYRKVNEEFATLFPGLAMT